MAPERGAPTAVRPRGIAAAMRRGASMPPVELIQAADGYYVRDGHHRISVARAAGQASIEGRIAYVLVN